VKMMEDEDIPIIIQIGEDDRYYPEEEIELESLQGLEQKIAEIINKLRKEGKKVLGVTTVIIYQL